MRPRPTSVFTLPFPYLPPYVPPACRIHRYTTVQSTNTVAFDLAHSGAPAWTVVVADRQTHGRGRLQRAWFSPAGEGLYFSVILKPSLSLADLPRLTLVAGVAVCQALESCGVHSPQLKWPNDILLASRKAGGILTETGPVSDAASTQPDVVIGIGLNISTPYSAFPAELRDKATSIAAASGQTISPEPLLQEILARLRIGVSLLEEKGIAAVLPDWRSRDGLQGKTLAWLTAAGNVVEGVGLGIDDAGLYRIRDRQGTVHEVLSGDLDLASKEHGGG